MYCAFDVLGLRRATIHDQRARTSPKPVVNQGARPCASARRSSLTAEPGRSQRRQPSAFPRLGALPVSSSSSQLVTMAPTRWGPAVKGYLQGPGGTPGWSQTRFGVLGYCATALAGLRNKMIVWEGPGMTLDSRAGRQRLAGIFH